MSFPLSCHPHLACYSRLACHSREGGNPVNVIRFDKRRLNSEVQPRDVLFIDEIHRLSTVVEETLYPAMEDGQLDIILGEGPTARSIKLEIA